MGDHHTPTPVGVTHPTPVVDFEAMKRNFELVTLQGPLAATLPTLGGQGVAGSSNGIMGQDPRQRFATSPAVLLDASAGLAPGPGPAGVTSSLNGYGLDPNAAVYPMNGLLQQPATYPYGGAGPAGALPFIPQAQLQQQHFQNGAAQMYPPHPQQPDQYALGTSPYMGMGAALNPGMLDSPNSINGLLPPTQSFNGSAYGGGAYDFDPTASSSGPYSPQSGYSQFPAPLFNPALFMAMLPGTAPPGGYAGFGLGNGIGHTQYHDLAGRTVYVGNLPSDASVDELLSQVRFGPIENVKVLPEKLCAFISFLDSHTAAAFHSDAQMRKLRLHDNELRIGWGKPTPVSQTVVTAVQQSGATRNVYLGNLPETVTEQSLRDDLSRFGPIDQVKIVRDKNIGFVHFLSISTAIKVVQNLPLEQDWLGRRISYGKDRCAYVPKNQHQQQQHNLAAAARGNLAANYAGYGLLAPTMMIPNGFEAQENVGNRTTYLGNVHPQTTIEEICNTIRGGVLQQIRYIPDRHICFVTFVDASCAFAFYQSASYQGIALHNRRLKIGWGKHSGPVSPGISMLVEAGGSRNVYVGNIDDFDTYTEHKLRTDFGEFGEIELINSLREKQCAFINFTNIANAIKAIEAMKTHPDYSLLKIAYGKDRCGNPPRVGGFGFGPRNYLADGMGFVANTNTSSPLVPGSSPNLSFDSGHLESTAGEAKDDGRALGLTGLEPVAAQV